MAHTYRVLVTWLESGEQEFVCRGLSSEPATFNGEGSCTGVG